MSEREHRRKVSTTVYIEEEQDQRLFEISERTGLPMAELIRQGIDLVLAKMAKEQGG